MEREVATDDGRWYIMRPRPYRTVENVINGVVVTPVDIAERRESARRLREREARLRALVEAMSYAT